MAKKNTPVRVDKEGEGAWSFGTDHRSRMSGIFRGARVPASVRKAMSQLSLQAKNEYFRLKAEYAKVKYEFNRLESDPKASHTRIGKAYGDVVKVRRLQLKLVADYYRRQDAILAAIAGPADLQVSQSRKGNPPPMAQPFNGAGGGSGGSDGGGGGALACEYINGQAIKYVCTSSISGNWIITYQPEAGGGYTHVVEIDLESII